MTLNYADGLDRQVWAAVLPSLNFCVHKGDDRMNLRTRFGGRIRELRTARRITQERLAKKSGLSVDSIRRIEGGALSPSLETIHKVAVGLEISLSTLFSGLDEGQSTTFDELVDFLEQRRPNVSGRALKVLQALLSDPDSQDAADRK